jgi:integrase
MASIRRRQTGAGQTWQVRFRLGGNSTSETFHDPAAATEFAALVDRVGPEAARRVRDDRAGSPSAGRVPTIAEAVADHVETISGITVGTRRDYRKIAALIADSALGPLPVDALTEDAVARWIASQPHAAKTIRNRHALLSAAMTRQVKLGTIPTNPCRGVKIGRTERREMVTLSEAELGQILEHLDPHWHPLVVTLARTGLRFGEATALQVRDLDLDAVPPTLRVARAWKHTDGGTPELGPPKTARGRRVVSLPPEVVNVLRPLVAEHHREAFVLTNTRGAPIRQNSFHEIWSKALDRAAIGKRPRIHDLRHTHASWLIARGVPLPLIQRRLGHESITTTVDTYGGLADDALSVMAQAASAIHEPLPELTEG